VQTEHSARSTVFDRLADLVTGMVDWDVELSEPISDETLLVRDLDFQSLDVAMLIVAVEGEFKQQGLPFEEILMANGSFVSDLRFGDFVDFLTRALEAGQGEP
jgi:acyl carrier protein